MLMHIKSIILNLLKESSNTNNNILSVRDIFEHYYQHGNLEDIFLSKLKDNQLKWLFNQILEVITELRKHGIYCEYLNSSNWGLKKDKNLAIFDLGYGNYFEEFEVEPTTLDIDDKSNVLSQILKKMGIKTSKYIDSGTFGHAHDIGNNKILKITKDKTEAINSKKILGKKMSHIADIYDVRQTIINETPYYIIILEKLLLSKKLEVLYKKLTFFYDESRNKHIDKTILTKIYKKNKIIGDFLKDMVNLGYTKTWEKWIGKLQEKGLLSKYDFNDISEIADWIKGSVTNDNDIENEPPEFIFKLVKQLTI